MLGNWVAARILAEQTVKSIAFSNQELKPFPISEGVAMNAGITHPSPHNKKKAGNVSQAPAAVGEADVQSFYRKQRQDQEDMDMRGVSKMDIAALQSKMTAASKMKMEDKILTSVLSGCSHLASDLRSILLVQHTQTVTKNLSLK